MRILLVGVGYRGYVTLHEQALRSLGHEVLTYVGLKQHDFLTRLHRATRVTLPSALGVQRDYLWSEQQRFLSWFRQSRPQVELALFANSDRLATDAILHEIRNTGATTGAWLLDEVGTLKTSELKLQSFDLLASFSEEQIQMLSTVSGKNVLYMPQGFAPVAFKSASTAWKNALVLGAAYPSRRLAVDSMIAGSYGVDVVGRTWRTLTTASGSLHRHGDVSLAESVALSSNGRVSVNGHRSRTAGVSPRVFEIAGAGGLLIDDNPRSPDFFEPGKEMLTWASGEDLIEHAQRLRREPCLAHRLAAAAQHRVRSEHRIAQRFANLISDWGM